MSFSVGDKLMQTCDSLQYSHTFTALYLS